MNQSDGHSAAIGRNPFGHPLRPGNSSNRLKGRLGRLLSGDRWISLATVVALVSVWIVITSSGLVRALFLPSPSALVAAAADLVAHGFHHRPIWEHIWLTLTRVTVGFGTGALVGIGLGLSMGYSRVIDRFFAPLVEFFRPLPQLSYLILLVIWLGIGETPQYVLLFLTALPIAVVSARDGVRRATVQRIQAALSLGASRFDVFRYVVLPSALPEIFAGFRLAVGAVYATVISAEIISGSSGVGWMIFESERILASSYMFVGIAFLGIVGLALDAGARAVEARVVHWQGAA